VLIRGYVTRLTKTQIRKNFLTQLRTAFISPCPPKFQSGPKKSPVCQEAHGASFAVLEDGSALAANPDRITGLWLRTDRRFWFIGVSALTPDTSTETLRPQPLPLAGAVFLTFLASARFACSGY
jgi:hypothetical protein